MKNKVEAQPRKVNKKNCVVKPVHDVNVKHSMLHANSEPVCATCSSKKAKIVESKNANHLEPNHTLGSDATDIPSSSTSIMTGCPDCSLVSGLRMFKTHDRESLSAHELSPSFLWAEAINTACCTQNRSIIRRQYNKTLYELKQDKENGFIFSFLSLVANMVSTNDSDDLGKLDAKPDIGIFVGYAPAKKAFRINNKRTQKIIETIHVTFDELTATASEQFSSGPRLQCMTPLTSSLGLVPNPVS
ncbi:retrovirus-related pol polyprotein from transposon TNT 1-94 [Tanacetum coccineum]